MFDGPVIPDKQLHAVGYLCLLTAAMGSSSGYMLFTFQPTFTQGLILGQFSILILLAVILKYLFLDTEHSQNVPVYADPAPPVLKPSIHSAHVGENAARVESESTEWLNILLHEVGTRFPLALAPASSVC